MSTKKDYAGPAAYGNYTKGMRSIPMRRDPVGKENKSRRAYLLVKPSLMQRARECAGAMGTSFNQIVENALEMYLRKNQF